MRVQQACTWIDTFNDSVSVCICSALDEDAYEAGHEVVNGSVKSEDKLSLGRGSYVGGKRDGGLLRLFIV